MAGIQGISNIGSAGSSPSIAPRATSEVKTGFAPALQDALSKVDNKQHTASQAIQDLITGRQEDVTSVVSQVADADLSFKLLMGVRNKIIDAYKQTMNMQV